jgi:hypothetical protein
LDESEKFMFGMIKQFGRCVKNVCSRIYKAAKGALQEEPRWLRVLDVTGATVLGTVGTLTLVAGGYELLNGNVPSAIQLAENSLMEFGSAAFILTLPLIDKHTIGKLLKNNYRSGRGNLEQPRNG